MKFYLITLGARVIFALVSGRRIAAAGVWLWFMVFRLDAATSGCDPASFATNVSQGGTIVFNCDGIITLTNTLVVNNHTEINGTGRAITIAGNNAFRLFHVKPGVKLTLIAVTLSGGRHQGAAGRPGATSELTGGPGDPGHDGGNAFGGAIFNEEGTVALVNSTVADCSAVGGAGGNGGAGRSDVFGSFGGNGGAGGFARGAAIYNQRGAVELVGCTFAQNLARGGAGGAGGNGGAGANGNGGGHGGDGGAARGGAIYNLSGTLNLTNCTFSTNQVIGAVGGQGGTATGISAGGDGGSGGAGQGGAIFNDSASAARPVHCTFAFNLAQGGLGGAKGTAEFSSTDGEPGDKGSARGTAVFTSGEFSSRNNIFAGTNAPNLFGFILDEGHNLSSDASGQFTATGSQQSIDPMLAPLQRGSGPTQIHPLLSGSPAIDQGDCGTVLSDQRGVARPIGPGCDIGAAEFDSVFMISGRITEAGRGVAGVTVTAGSVTASSDTNGLFRFTNLNSGSYTLTLPTNGIGFEPGTRSLVVGPDAANIDFQANRVRLTSFRELAVPGVATRLLGLPGRHYLVESSTNLQEWSTVLPVTTDASGLFLLQDSTSTNFPFRFFRSLVAP